MSISSSTYNCFSVVYLKETRKNMKKSGRICCREKGKFIAILPLHKTSISRSINHTSYIKHFFMLLPTKERFYSRASFDIVTVAFSLDVGKFFLALSLHTHPLTHLYADGNVRLSPPHISL